MTRYAIHLRVLRDGELFVSQTLAPGAHLSLGPNSDATVPTEALSARLDLLVPTAQGYGLHLLPHPVLEGQVRTQGRVLRVERGLLVDPRPEPLVFGDGASGELSLGRGLSLQFSIHRQRQFRRWGRPDPGLVVALAAACLLLGGATLIIAPWRPGPRKTTREVRLVQRPVASTRLAHLTVPAVRHTRPRGIPSPTRVQRPRRSAAAPRRLLQQGVLDALNQARRRHRGLMDAGSSDRLLHRLDRSLASVTANGRTSGTNDPLMGLLGSTGHEALIAPTLAPLHLPSLPRTTPKIMATASPASSGPSREEIRKVVARQGGQIRLCYEREILSSSRPLEGRLVFQWVIDVEGKVKNITLVRGTANARQSRSLRDCVTSRIQTWIFPRCKSGTCVVVYPFDFYPATVNPS